MRVASASPPITTNLGGENNSSRLGVWLEWDGGSLGGAAKDVSVMAGSGLTQLIRSLGRDQRHDVRECAEAPVAAAEVGDGRGEVIRAEIRPQGVDKAELGVGGFPEQEIRQPFLAPGADEQIDVLAGAVPGEQLAEGLAGRR